MTSSKLSLEQSLPLVEKSTDLENQTKETTTTTNTSDNVSKKIKTIKHYLIFFVMAIISIVVIAGAGSECRHHHHHHLKHHQNNEPSLNPNEQDSLNLVKRGAEQPQLDFSPLVKREEAKEKVDWAKKYEKDIADVKQRLASEDARKAEQARRRERIVNDIKWMQEEEKKHKESDPEKYNWLTHRWREFQVAMEDQDRYNADAEINPVDIRKQKQMGKNMGLEPKGNKIIVLTATDGKGSNNEIEGIHQMAEQNRRDFCNLHGYTYAFSNLSHFDLKGAHPVWGKINAIRKAFDDHPEAEWVWWMDLDMIITNPYIDLAASLLNPAVLEKRLSYGRPVKAESGYYMPNYTTGYNPNAPLPPGAVTNYQTGNYEFSHVDDIGMVISHDGQGYNAGSFFVKRGPFIDMFLDYWPDKAFVEKHYGYREQAIISHMSHYHPYINKRIGIVGQRWLNAYISGDYISGWDVGDLAIHYAGCWVHHECNERWFQYWVNRELVPEEYRVKLPVTDKQ